MNSGCGSLEFDTFFRTPNVYVYDTKHLKSVGIIDSMEYKQEIMYPVNTAKEPMVIEDVKLCTKRVLLDICVIDEAIERVYVSVELLPKVCYVDEKDLNFKPDT